MSSRQRGPYDPPIPPSSGPTRRRHPRDSLPTTTTTTTTRGTGTASSTPTQSPITTRSGRILGSTKKSSNGGPSFSPYARKSTSTHSQPRDQLHDHEHDHEQQQPGILRRALGFLWRGGSATGGVSQQNGGMKASQSLSSLSSLTTSGGQEEMEIEATGAKKGKGLPQFGTAPAANQSALKSRSRTVGDLKRVFEREPSVPVRANRRDRERSAHSTLVLPPTTATPANGNGRQTDARQLSPFSVSGGGLGGARRSPSPVQTTDLFHPPARRLPLPPSPTRSTIFPSTISQSSHSQLPTSHTQSNFGLTSRSPFASHAGSTGIARSMSVSSIPSLSHSHRDIIGHPLYPYASPNQRGVSPSLYSNAPVAQHTSNGGGGGRLISPSRHLGGGGASSAIITGSGGGLRRTSTMAFGRMGSPLRMGYMSNGETEGGPAMKKKRQMVWDPEKGITSKEELERDRPVVQVPKNDAERILETLEGMGRTPLGGIGTPSGSAFARPREISVPITTHSLPHAHHHFSPTTPYARTKAKDSVRSGTGLSAVFRAREERRRAAEEEERKEREREREKAEKRARKERERERVLSDDEERLGPGERRKTRSMAKDKSKSPAPASVSRSAKGKGKQVDSDVPMADEATPSKATRSSRRLKSPSPAIASAAVPFSAPAPPPRAKSPSPPPAPPTQSSQPPPPQPQTQTQPQKAAASSLRPGRSHSSRQHTQSSRIAGSSFSAREEDLPEVSEEDLGKIKLPIGMFPEGFTFGNPSVAPPKKVEVPATSSGGGGGGGADLLSRMTPVDSTTPKPPTFSFSAPVASAPPKAASPFSFAPSPTPPPPSATPTFSLGTASSAPTTFKPTAPASSSDFFAKPPSSISSASSTPPPPATTNNGKPPNFFGAVLAENKAVTPPSATVAPPFSFGAPKGPALIVEKSVEAPSSAPVSNPFAAFGKPIAEIVKEDSKAGAVEQKQNGFVAPDTGLFGKKAEEKKDSPFSFGSTTSAPAFGIAKPSVDAPLPINEEPVKAASLFSFQTKPASATAATPPPFNFGAAAKPPVAPTPTPTLPTSSLFGSVVPAIEDPDEDSGMEDETGTTDPLPAPVAVKPTTSGFNFGTTPVASPPSTAFGSSNGGFKFGEKKEATPAPFAFGSTGAGSGGGGGVFGGQGTSAFNGAPASAVPSFGGFGSPSPSPAPQSPVPTSNAFSSTPNPFAFGSPTAPSTSTVPPTASTGFTFGSASTAAPGTPTNGTTSNPFGSATTSNPFAGPSAPAMAQTFSAPGFSTTNGIFGGSGAAAPSSPAPQFQFGTTTTQQQQQVQTAPSTPGGTPSPFQFGSTTSNATSGGFPGFGSAAAGGSPFNFQATGTGSVSVPGTPTGGVGGTLFSVGSGGDESPGKRRIAGMRKKRG